MSLRGLGGVAVVLAVLAGAVAWLAYGRYTEAGPLTQPLTVVVPKGSGIDGMARRLAEAGVLANAWPFQVAARLERVHPKAGEYLFPAGISAEGALRQMVEGHTVVHHLTIAEGLTVRRVLDLVLGAEYLDGAVARTPSEGSLLPETWYLSWGDSRDELVTRMQRSMQAALDGLWAGRAAGLPLASKEQALVLASIVERETGLTTERPHVAQVFENRLRLGMRLQSDPTVIYGLSGGAGVLDRPLTHADLASPHRWNTYVIDGLPQTPIANPGRASLEAVLHPAPGNDLYFVADGTGGHVFAATLAEHNANVARWRHVLKDRDVTK